MKQLEKIETYCDICQETRNFIYLGVQHDNEREYKLYNCEICGDTLTKSTLERKNIKKNDRF